MGRRIRLVSVCFGAVFSLTTNSICRIIIATEGFQSRTVRGKHTRTHQLWRTTYSKYILPRRYNSFNNCVGLSSGNNINTNNNAKVRLRRYARITQHTSFVQPTEEWLHRYLSLSESEQRKINLRWPNSIDNIRRLGRRRLHTWLNFFLSDEVGLNNNQLRAIIVARPQLLSYSLSNMQATTSYFCDELGLSSNEYKSLLQSYPSVMMYSIDHRLRPTVDFLQNDCGGGKDNWSSWKRVVYSYPNIFSHSLEKTLLPKIQFLCHGDSEKSLSLKRSELSQLVAKFPPILWLSEENLQSKLDFLSESLDLEKSELKSMVVSYPQILGLSLHNNLQPKIDFFLKSENDEDHTIHPCCGLNRAQLKEFVMYQPALLAYSLENRLKPRIRRMQEKNIFFYYCPKNIMSYTDKKFDLWMMNQEASWSIL